MNKQRIFFTISLILLLIILFTTQNQKPITKGQIKQIQYSQNKITIQLKNQETPIILFTSKPLELIQNQEITIYGKQEQYKGKSQIIANKITKTTS